MGLYFLPFAARSENPQRRVETGMNRTALKNSQLSRRLPDDITIVCETVH